MRIAVTALIVGGTTLIAACSGKSEMIGPTA